MDLTNSKWKWVEKFTTSQCLLTSHKQLQLETHKNEESWRQQPKLKFAASASFCPAAPLFFLFVATSYLVCGFGSGPFCTSHRGTKKNTGYLALFAKVLATRLALLLRHTSRYDAYTATSQIQRTTKRTLHVRRPTVHIRNTLEACQAITKPRFQSHELFLPLQVRKSGRWDNTTRYSFKGLFTKAGQGWWGVDSSNTTVMHWSLTFCASTEAFKGIRFAFAMHHVKPWLAKPHNVLRMTGITLGRKLWQTWPFRKETWLTYCIQKPWKSWWSFNSARSSFWILISSSGTFALNETRYPTTK